MYSMYGMSKSHGRVRALFVTGTRDSINRGGGSRRGGPLQGWSQDPGSSGPRSTTDPLCDLAQECRRAGLRIGPRVPFPLLRRPPTRTREDVRGPFPPDDFDKSENQFRTEKIQRMTKIMMSSELTRNYKNDKSKIWRAEVRLRNFKCKKIFILINK